MKPLFTALALVLFASTTALAAERLREDETRRLADLGAKIFGVKWGPQVQGIAERGVTAASDGTTTFTVREKGGAYIVSNRAAVASGGLFAGSDDELRRRGLDVFKGLGIDPKEIAETKVLQQFVQSGQLDPQTRRMRTQPSRLDKRMLWLTRSIAGIPVWSSRLVMTLDRDGRIAFLEMAWPRIEPKVLEEAQRLQRLGASFRAPDVALAKPEQVAAGILHSAAIGFFNDQTAAIRVIYRATRPGIGKKPVYYLTAEGQPVTLPRTIEPLPSPQKSRPAKTQKLPR